MSENKILQFKESFFLSAGEANAEQEMAKTLLVTKLIDIATAHANHLGIGNPYMPDPHCGWVLSRLTVEMSEYPKVNENYSITTWVQGWNRHFSERSFCIENQEGRAIGYARSIWMILDTRTHTNFPIDSLPAFSDALVAGRENLIPSQAKHRLIIAEGEEENSRVLKATDVDNYRFQYCDLDGYRHVNTVRYLALLMNQYSLEQHDAMQVRRFELSFLNEGAYGKMIDILKSPLSERELQREAIEGWSEKEEFDKSSAAFMLRDHESRQPILYARIFMSDRKK